MNNELSDLTVVILTHKTNKNILENCLSSIDQKVKIILVENSENFLLKDYVEDKYKNVSIFCSGSNLGYSGGNNFGLKLTKTPYVLILNPDTICKENFFLNITEYLNDKLDYTIIGCQYENDPNWQPAGYFNKKTKLEDMNNSNNQKLLKVDWVVGCAMLLNLKKFNSKIVFDDNFFLFFEEFDLCRRLHNNKLVFSSNKLIVDHLGFKGSFAFNKKYEFEAIKLRNWHYLWSQFYFNKKHDGYFLAYWKGFFKIIPFFLKFIYFTFVNNALEKNKYKYRFLGLLNSMLLKKSKFRIDF